MEALISKYNILFLVFSMSILRLYYNEICKDFFLYHQSSVLEFGLAFSASHPNLVNKIKPGIIKRVNRLSTPIAGLDNVNIFLKACARLGLKEAQLFHPGDLQDLSTRVTVKHQEASRRIKNVLITIYWLGRKAQVDPLYNGPYLNLKAFEGLLDTRLYKALEDCTSPRDSVRECEFGDSWYLERKAIFPLQAGHRREDSLGSLDSLSSRTTSTSSDTTLKGSSEGCGSDPEAEVGFRMSVDKGSVSYRRSLTVTPKTTTQFNQFLPSKDKQSGYVPAPLRKRRAERHDDSRRSWASPMFTEEDGTFSRSKSMSDIAVEQAVTKQIQYEQLQKIRDQMRDSEDKWQDDLTKWKNRRKSVNSDIMKKKEEREQIESLTSSSSTRKSKTFKEMAEERENRGPGSYRSRFSTSDDQDVFEEPAPRSKTLPSRSYTIDNPYAFRDKPMVPSLSSLSDDEPVAGSMASDEAVSPQSPLNTSPGNQSKMSSSKENQTSIYSSRNLLDDPIPANITSKPSLVEPTSSSRSSSASSPPLDQASLYKLDSVQRKQPEVAQVSASLPRSYRRSDSARLTSVVTPRPFGTQSNRVASMPRAYTMDDSHKRFNGDAERSEKTTVPSRYAPFMKEDEAHSQTSSAHSSDEEEEEEVEEVEEQVAPSTHTLSSVTPVSRVSPQPKAVSPVNNAQQVGFYSDMRISLNQKPGTSRDFGFQSTWDSTGAHVKSIQPGSPAQLSHLQVGDEILTVNGHKVADMGYEQWKSSMDQALQQGSLLMDIRRHGKNNWGRDLPSLPFKSHKTINLTSADPLGSPETYLSSNVSFTSHPAVDTAVKTLNVTSQNANVKSEPISLKNLKRRSEFFEQGKRALPVPSLSASSNRWSWDPEEERRRQEKWQKEQERLLQENQRQEEQMRRKEEQERLEEEKRRRAEQEHLEEEKRRRAEQERLEEEKRRRAEKQRLEEERRRREEQERLEEERRRREQQKRLEEEKKKREEQERQRKEEERRRREEEERRPAGSLQLNKESLSQAELERQQIIQEMKKKTPLLTDSSWIRQQNTTSNTSKEPISLPMRRGESLDNLDSTLPSWRSSWTPGSTSSIPDYSRPYSSSSSHHPASATLPASQSLSSLRQSWSTSSTPAQVHNRQTDPQSRNRSVSGKKICTFCEMPLGKGAAMIIESLGLCYHLPCFKCIECKADLGGSEAGAEVRIRNKQLYCNSCYTRVKNGQPNDM
uniref:LIM domain 7a n=1 Tax=Pygocentrus nattereri TaxID=42514 RepID=A0A3B4E0K4_PYGNA